MSRWPVPGPVSPWRTVQIPSPITPIKRKAMKYLLALAFASCTLAPEADRPSPALRAACLEKRAADYEDPFPPLPPPIDTALGCGRVP